MSSTWGNNIKMSIFGESHGTAIGTVLDGFPAGFEIDLDELYIHMKRRSPGRDKTTTPRKEADIPKIVSGVLNGVTTGAPICAVIENTNTRSSDYENVLNSPRPGHADFTGFLKYQGKNDLRGGGHFSGRLTAPLVFAGSLCRQLLAKKGVQISSHILALGSVWDDCLDYTSIEPKLAEKLSKDHFPVINQNKKNEMLKEIEAARLEQDSIGGIIECFAAGFPAGLGSPMFGGIENIVSSIVFGIPAVKGIEFGKGFSFAEMRGSESNDAFAYQGDTVVTKTNNCGGILGGISTGMPIIFKAAVKPTPSISKEQQTINLQREENCTISIHGRHDPCIVSRAAVVMESALALALLEVMEDSK